jgi:hypothetical protein
VVACIVGDGDEFDMNSNLVRAAGGLLSAISGVAYYNQHQTDIKEQAARLDRLSTVSECTRRYKRRCSGDNEALNALVEPLVVTGLLDAWPARSLWTFECLRHRIGHVRVDCGSAAAESALPFYYVAYNATKSEPGKCDLSVYVFDSNFDQYPMSTLLNDFSSLPSLDSEDVFSCGRAMAHKDRPTHRWLLVGPPGSGTLLHQDPWHYSSWNASLVGRKRWVLFPPHTDRSLLHPPRVHVGMLNSLYYSILGKVLGMEDGIPRSAAEFMEEVLPTIRGKGLGEVEIIQHPGEVIAFPAGWWHAVVNLDATIAVTESFGKERDLGEILVSLRKDGRVDLAAAIEAGVRDRAQN